MSVRIAVVLPCAQLVRAWRCGTTHPFQASTCFLIQLEATLHAIHSNRQDVHKAQVLGVLGEHWRKHA